jgi:nicotinate dehydrogenase subunit A
VGIEAGVQLDVNGVRRTVDAAPETPLLYVLRNHLGLAGTRFGSGTGQCGACVVMVDGRPMASCDLPLSFVSKKSVTTVEGLGRNGALHPVQSALIEHQAAQCGYCMSGIAVAAVALLESNPSPSEEQVRQALDKHLCRCGAHNRVVKAILSVAK